MFNLLFSLMLAGVFSLALALVYLVFVLFLYTVYRLDGGKMGLKKYMEYGGF